MNERTTTLLSTAALIALILYLAFRILGANDATQQLIRDQQVVACESLRQAGGFDITTPKGQQVAAICSSVGVGLNPPVNLNKIAQ